MIGVNILELGLTKKGNRYAMTTFEHFCNFAATYSVSDKTAETIRCLYDGSRWMPNSHG